MKVGELIDNYELCGTCIETTHPNFGRNWYLIIKVPAKYFADRLKFARLIDGSVLDYDSMKDDYINNTMEIHDLVIKKKEKSIAEIKDWKMKHSKGD